MLAKSSKYNQENSDIISRFNKIVKKFPNRNAVDFKDNHYSYSQVDLITDCIANSILALGVSRNERIAIYMDKSDKYLFCILGILKAGCTYIPLSKLYPKQRIDSILKISNVKVFITNQDSYSHRNEPKLCVVHYDELISPDFLNSDLKNFTGDPNDIAYIIFTSGSTGVPKGVPIYQKSVVNIADAINTDLLENNSDKELTIGVFAPFVFDASVGQIYTALLNGHRLNIVNDEIKLSVNSVLDYFNQANMDVVDLTPSFINIIVQWMDHYKENDILPKKIISMGEALPIKLLKKLFSLPNIQDMKLINAYGPTETCVYCTGKIYDKESALKCTEVTVGKPLKNSVISILKENLELAEFNEEGEICISGIGVGLGYIKMEDKTKEVFIRKSEITDGVIYRTGDIGKIMSNGEIVCMGRKDDQVKVRGYRIELEDIKNNIELFPDIKNCIVIAETEDDDVILIAYFVSDVEVDLNHLVKFLRDLLPDYLIPHYFVPVDIFSMTMNGKLDKSRLPDYKKNALGRIQLDDLDENYIGNVRIKILQKLICNLLHQSQISVQDNFFALGGTSLQVNMLAIQISTELGVNVNIADLYQCKNIVEMDQLISNTTLKKNHEKCTEMEEIRATFNQKRMLQNGKKNKFRDRYNDFIKDYDMLFTIQLSERLDVEKLKNALYKLCENQEGLRCVFQFKNREWYFKIKDELTDIFSYYKLQGAISNEKIFEYVKQNYMNGEALLHLYLFENEDNQNVITLLVSHSIFDFASLQIFLDLLFRYYDGENVEYCENSFSDYIRNIYPKERKEHYNFWKKYLSNRPYVHLFTPQFTNKFYLTFDSKDSFDCIEYELEEPIIHEVDKFCIEHKITPFIVFISALAVYMSIRTQQNDLILGINVNGRMNSDELQRIGEFTNQECLRFLFDNKETYTQVIEKTKWNYIQVLQHQIVSLDEIYKIQDMKDLKKGSIFGVLFNYIDFASLSKLGEKRKVKIDLFTRIEDYMPITWTVYRDKTRIRFKVSYNEEIFSKQFMETLVHEFNTILVQLFVMKKNEIDSLKIQKESR